MRIHRLFTRIFLWFWLAIILVAGAAAISIAWFHAYSSPERDHALMVAEAFLAMPSRLAVDVYESSGPQALRRHLDRWRGGVVSSAHLFDSTLNELAGQEDAEAFGELARDALADGQVAVRRADFTLLAARPVRGRDGVAYAYVARISPPGWQRPGQAGGPGPWFDAPGLPTDPPGPPSPADGPSAKASSSGPPPGPPLPPIMGLFARQPQAILLILGAVVVTGGAVCYWLARSLTAPLARLQRATQQLAGGDLSVRAGDVFQRRKDELGQLGRDFDRMAEKLDALVTSERQLLADVSHELRSPLARVTVALGIARQKADASIGPVLDRIERETSRLDELIGQVLLLARLEGGIEVADEERVELMPLVRRVVDDANYEAQERACQVKLVHADACTTIGKGELLGRAVENVVRNAVHYTDENTVVEVTLEWHHKKASRRAVIVVGDRGPGLSEASLKDMFRPFHRVGESRQRRREGTGLGLAIADRAVRAHGGTIEAGNRPGGGLQVTMTLPLRETALPSPGPADFPA